jgi:hypothetical protein
LENALFCPMSRPPRLSELRLAMAGRLRQTQISILEILIVYSCD